MAEKEKQLEKMTAEREKQNSRHPWLYIFSVILLIVIAVTFVGAPVVGDAVRGTTSSISFGKYGKEDIEFSQNGYFAQQREILGQQIKPESDSANWKWDMYRVWRGAFERTVVHVGILDEVKSNKTHISQEQLNKLIIENGPYQVNGEFDVELYQTSDNGDESIILDALERAVFKKGLYERSFHSVFVAVLHRGGCGVA